MTSDQGLKDGVTSVGHQAGVPLHLGPQLGHVPGQNTHICHHLSHHLEITPGHPLPPVVPLLIGYHSLTLVNGSLAGKPEFVFVFKALRKTRRVEARTF